jgi:hypothetical protein
MWHLVQVGPLNVINIKLKYKGKKKKKKKKDKGEKEEDVMENDDARPKCLEG